MEHSFNKIWKGVVYLVRRRCIILVSKLFLTQLSEVVASPGVQNLIVIKPHRVMEAAGNFLESGQDSLGMINKWVGIPLCALSLPVITKHKCVPFTLVLSQFLLLFIQCYLILKVLVQRDLNLLVQNKSAFYIGFDLVEF